MLKGVSFLITASIVILLVLSGPASAFTLKLDISDNKVSLGENISFVGEVDINSAENLPIENILLKLNGDEDVVCVFNPNGSIISGCKGISIEYIGNASFEYGYGYGYYDLGHDFGYGYGYTNGKLRYNFTLNTSDYMSGIYSTELVAQINGEVFSNAGDDIIIGGGVNISNLAAPMCYYKNSNLTVSANITGDISSVWVETNSSGVITNYSTYNIDSIYSAVIPGIVSGNMSWRFVVRDIIDNVVYGDYETVYVVHNTILEVSPSSPDGLNGWYRVEPNFSLSNPDATNLWYKWNGDSPIVYTGPFGLEDIPNAPPVESAGVVDLNYYSDSFCGVEGNNREVFYVDLTAPVIKDLSPGNGSTVYNELRPEILAYLDEVYQSNSGINESSIVMKLDNVVVIPTITDHGLDRSLSYTPDFDLTSGVHSVSISVSDNAGWNSELMWEFEVELTNVVSLEVNSPENGFRDSRRVPFNMTMSEEVLTLEYINYEDRNPKWRTLCKNCDEYGNERKKTKTLTEGQNNLSFKVVDMYGSGVVVNRDVFIDSRDPSILKVGPRRGFGNGTFTVEFRELNPVNLTLFYGNGLRSSELDLNLCVQEKDKYFCEIDVNLSEFDGSIISYWFVLEDISGNVDTSRAEEISVDFSQPVINSAEFSLNGRREEIVVNVTEANLEEVEYYDNSDSKAKWKSLCRRLDHETGLCVGRVSLDDGVHNITIRASDEVGFITIHQMDEFIVDTKDPVIKKIAPQRGFSNGVFSVEFSEANPTQLFLNYGNINTGYRNSEVNLGECTGVRSGRESCLIEVNLSDYDTEEVMFSFNITDVLGNSDVSKENTVDVDSTRPILNNPDTFWVQGIDRYYRNVYFDFNVTEENFEDISYYDYSEGDKARWRKLCTRLKDSLCEKKKSFRSGNHSIEFRISDRAGNEIFTPLVEFEVS